MNRQQVKELLPIIQAFAEGKEIEVKLKSGSKWCAFNENDLYYIKIEECDFRIKPEPKYRPFKDANECWQEMQKHQPFGWVKTIANIPELHNISAIFPSAEYPILLGTDIEDGEASEYSLKMAEMLDLYVFIDDTPFGIKEK